MDEGMRIMWVERRYWMKRAAYRHLGIQSPWDAVAKVLPQRLRYWVLIREGSKHIRSNEVVPEVPFTTILQRAER